MALKSPITLTVRTFSSSSIRNSRNDLVKPPVQIFGLDGKYATALYSASSKQNQLEAVEKELVKLRGTLKTDKQLREFILNPTIKRNLKATALEGIAKKLNLTASSTNFLAMLAENGRLNHFTGIMNAFSTIMSAYRGDVICEVSSAKALDDATKKEVESSLRKFAKKGENILINWKVDPTLVGGLVVSIGDKYVDMSIARKIKMYTDILKASG